MDILYTVELSSISLERGASSNSWWEFIERSLLNEIEG